MLDKILGIIEALKVEVSNLEAQRKELLNLDDLLSLNEDELMQLAAEYGIENKEDFTSSIKHYKELLTVASYLSNTLENCKLLVESYINSINDKITSSNDKNNTRISNVKKLIDAYEKVFNYLNGDSDLETEELFECFDVIKTYPLGGNTLEIILETCKKMLERTMEIEEPDVQEIINAEDDAAIDNFEQDIEVDRQEVESHETTEEVPSAGLSEYRQQKINLANGLLIRFFSPASGDYLGNPASECEDPTSTLEEIEASIEDDGLSKYYFGIVLNKIISCIKDPNISDDDLQFYVEKLDHYLGIYSKSKDYVTELNNQLKNIDKSYGILVKMTEKRIYSQYMYDIKQQIMELNKWVDQKKRYADEYVVTEEAYNRFLDEINEKISSIDGFVAGLKDKVNASTEAEESKTEIASFVLFGTNKDAERTPYIMSDIFGVRRLVDPAVVNSTRNNMQELSKLIENIFILGNAAAVIEINTSKSSFKEKLISRIKFPNNKGERGEKPTDMWRIRPEKSSNVRFAERIITIPKNTKLFSQVVSIIKEVCPYFEIDDSKDFPIMVNIGAAIKRSDEDLYSETIKRYYDTRIDIFELFYVGGIYESNTRYNQKKPVLKTEFTPEECEIFRSYVAASMDTIKQMKEKDPDCDFGQLLDGGVTHGNK